jgi:hypothetical protein
VKGAEALGAKGGKSTAEAKNLWCLWCCDGCCWLMRLVDS